MAKMSWERNYIHVNLFDITSSDFLEQTCILPKELTCYNSKTSKLNIWSHNLLNCKNENNNKTVSFVAVILFHSCNHIELRLKIK